MNYYQASPYSYLAHHGILGQQWGKRNGPPYPLDAQDHSASEKRAGWKKSLDKDGEKPDNKRKERVVIVDGKRVNGRTPLTAVQKKAIGIGVTAAALALATYGAYRMGYLDKDTLGKIHDAGKNVAGDLLGKLGDKPVSGFKAPDIPSTPKQGFQKLAQRESVDTVLSKVNPSGSNHNCYNVVTATTARLCGFDVTAKGDTQGGKGLAFDEVCKVFKLNPDNPSDVRRIQNPTVERIARQIEKHYSEGDVGAIGLNWKESPRMKGGHTLNWVIRNGKAEFIDGQVNKRGDRFRAFLGANISKDHEVSIARFANTLQGLNLDTDVDIELFKKMVNGS